jgi:hypothetical protein
MTATMLQLGDTTAVTVWPNHTAAFANASFLTGSSTKSCRLIVNQPNDPTFQLPNYATFQLPNYPTFQLSNYAFGQIVCNGLLVCWFDGLLV